MMSCCVQEVIDCVIRTNPYRLSILRFERVDATDSPTFRVHMNRKVDTTAADSNRQGDVQARTYTAVRHPMICWLSMESVSRLWSDWQQHAVWPWWQAGTRRPPWRTEPVGKLRLDYAAKNIAFVPTILSVAGKIRLDSKVPASSVSKGEPADGLVLQPRWRRGGHQEWAFQIESG